MTSSDVPAVPLLAAENLTAGYRQQRILFDVNATFRPGVITAIIGTNGAGKSTLVKSLFGLTHIFAGRLLVAGVPMPPVAHELVARGISYVPQVANVFPSLTVRENLEVGTYVRSGGSLDMVVHVFPPLGRLMTRTAHKLSGGERNMLAVGRAIMSNPEMLLLDEATGGLAPALASEFWEYVVGLAQSGVGIVAVEQNVDLALKFSDYAYVLAAGRVVLTGPARDVARREDFEQIFLVSSTTGLTSAAARTGPQEPR
jgi:ABC-type branched-subunit amino acid transport system ATPase component